jgi:transcriptional regulator with XRE-family HTH domain
VSGGGREAAGGGPAAPRAQPALGRNLRACRLAKGWTVRQLGARCGLTLQYLYGMEWGGTTPSVWALARLAAALDVDPDVLLLGSAAEPAAHLPPSLLYQLSRLGELPPDRRELVLALLDGMTRSAGAEAAVEPAADQPAAPPRQWLRPVAHEALQPGGFGPGATYDRILAVLRTAVRSSGRTQIDVDRAIGRRRGYLNRVFRGRVEMKLRDVLKVLSTLGLDAGALLAPALARESGRALRLAGQRGAPAPSSSPG